MFPIQPPFPLAPCTLYLSALTCILTLPITGARVSPWLSWGLGESYSQQRHVSTSPVRPQQALCNNQKHYNANELGRTTVMFGTWPSVVIEKYDSVITLFTHLIVSDFLVFVFLEKVLLLAVQVVIEKHHLARELVLYIAVASDFEGK